VVVVAVAAGIQYWVPHLVWVAVLSLTVQPFKSVEPPRLVQALYQIQKVETVWPTQVQVVVAAVPSHALEAMVAAVAVSSRSSPHQTSIQ
jgi:hypothetical protein